MFKVWSEISEAYKILKIAERFTNIAINQFTNGEKPWSQKPLLKGKAAELKHLAPVLALVAWNKAKHFGTMGLGPQSLQIPSVKSTFLGTS